jgi:hypothetical protein
MNSIKLFSLTTLLFAVSVGSVNAQVSDRFKSWLKSKDLKLVMLTQNGCRSDRKVPIGVNMKDGNVFGYVFPSRRGNPPEKRNPQKFQFKIREDGRYGGTEGHENRFWLRPHSSGDPKYQWVGGKVNDSEIQVTLTMGSPDHSDSFCDATGSVAK